MKKTKSIFCGILLSTCLVGNVFAGGFTGYGVFSIFDNVINVVVTMLREDPCEGRTCTNCKPGGGVDGICRPPDN